MGLGSVRHLSIMQDRQSHSIAVSYGIEKRQGRGQVASVRYKLLFFPHNKYYFSSHFLRRDLDGHDLGRNL